MVGGGVHVIPADFEPLSYIARAYRNSECRVAIIAALEDGDPFPSIAKLARDKGCAVWTIETTNPKNEQNALDYIDVGLQNGDWVYLSGIETCSDATLREIGLILNNMKPEPKKYPRRELFRLWLAVDKHIDINEHVNPVVPQLLAQTAIIARKGHVPGEAVSPMKMITNKATTPERPPRGDAGVSPEKWVKRLPQEPKLYEHEIIKHQERREQGRDSDSESDTEEPGQKIVGKWFYRAVDFHLADAGSTITKASEEVFKRTEEDDGAGVAELCKGGQINLVRLKHKPTGMTLLQYACSLEKVQAAKALLEAGADPNIPRESDGCPPLFMSIESPELVQALIDHGANIDARYEGYSLEKHPLTAPHIAKMIKELKGY